MKRINAILTVILLMLMPHLVVMASSSSDVWNDLNVESDCATVNLYASSGLGNGYFEIQYDEAVLACSEDDVIFQAGVDMHSVNIKDGAVIIAVLSDMESAKEAFATIRFTPAEGVDKLATDSVKVTFYGEANDLNGNTLKVANTANKIGTEQIEQHSIVGKAAVICVVAAVIVCVLVIFFVRKTKSN